MYRERFYAGRRKVADVAWLREQLTVFGLAVWIMDDGSADGNGLRLNTHRSRLTRTRAWRRFYGLNSD